MRKILFLLLSGVLTAAELSLPVVEAADYVIKFNRNAGIYELYYRDQASKRLINLLGAPNPHTDYLSLSLDGKLYTLGRDERYLASIQQRLQVLSNGGAIKWLLPYQIDVTQYLRIIDQQPLVSYVKMDIVVDNRSSINRSVGLFQLYDLDKAQSGAPAFRVPEGEVYRESFYQGSSIPAYVRTSYDFYLYFDIRGTTRPQRITLAPWRKIHDAGWNYAFSLNRQGFGYNLYDTNSPALGVYYDPRPLMSGQSRIYTTYLSRQLLVEPKESVSDKPLFPISRQPTTPEPLPEKEASQPAQDDEVNMPQKFESNAQILKKLTALEEKLDAWQEEQEAISKEKTVIESAPKSQTAEKTVIAVSKINDLAHEQELYLNQKQRFLLLEKLQQQLAEKLQSEQQQLLQLATYYRLGDSKPSLSDIQLLIDQARNELSIWDANYLRLMSITKEENSELAKLHTLLASSRSSLEQDYLSWQSLYNLLNVIDIQQFNSLSLEHILKEFSSALSSSREKYQVLADLQRYNYGVAERLTDPNFGRFYSEFARLISAQRHYLSSGVALLEQWDDFLRGEVKSWLLYRKQAEQLNQLFLEISTALEHHKKNTETTKNDLYLASQLFETLEEWHQNGSKSEQKSIIIDISNQKEELDSIMQRLDVALENASEQLDQLSDKLSTVSEKMHLFRLYFSFHKQNSFLLVQWQESEKKTLREDAHLRLKDKMADTYKQPIYPLNEDKLYSSLENKQAKHLVEEQPRINDQEEYQPDRRQNTIMGAPIFNIQPNTPNSLPQSSIFDNNQEREKQSSQENQEKMSTKAITSTTPKRFTPSPQALTGQPTIPQRKSTANNSSIIQDKSNLQKKQSKQYAPQFEQPLTSDPLTHSPLSQETDSSFSQPALPNNAVDPLPNSSLPREHISSLNSSTGSKTNPLNNPLSNSLLDDSIPSRSPTKREPSQSQSNQLQQQPQAEKGVLDKNRVQVLEETREKRNLLLQELLKESEQVLTNPYSFEPEKVARIRQIWQQLQEEEP